MDTDNNDTTTTTTNNNNNNDNTNDNNSSSSSSSSSSSRGADQHAVQHGRVRAEDDEDELGWVFITGGCSVRGVQWIGVVSYNKTVYNVI